jgi:transcription antitermination factor NusG
VQVRRALALTPDLKPVLLLKKGQRVRIISGPLQGAEGVVRSLTSSMRVILSVDMIGMGVAVTAARADIEVIH